MASFHFNVAQIRRSSGRSVVAAAAYRSGARLHDERLGRDHDFSAKGDAHVAHAEVMLPAGSPERFAKREALWNEVERVERRCDAQLATDVTFALPRELPVEAAVELARRFVEEAFVSRGMIADLAIHVPRAGDGEAQPHAHVLLVQRAVGENGLGLKNRAWNNRALVSQWRELLAVRTNQALARAGRHERVDHRSYEAQGVRLTPTRKLGAAIAKLEAEGKPSERGEGNRRIAQANADAIRRDPTIALDALTVHQSTFTRPELARLVNRYTATPDKFRAVMAAVEASPDLVRLGKDSRGEERFTSRQMIEVERRLEAHAAALAERQGHAVPEAERERALAGAKLGPEQRQAFRHVTGAAGLALVTGYAGTGKSRMLGAAREAWEAAGYTVRGAALSGIAAQSLEHGSGIGSRTLASLEWAWARGRDQLGGRDVLVIDEAGLVGSRQLQRVLDHARAAGAKVVAVGDPEQLQAIEAGSPFRLLAERHGSAELTQVRRQISPWMQQATKELATGRADKALARYEAAGMVHLSDTREAAMGKLVAQWEHDRRERPERSQIILAYTRADVRALNDLARERMRAAGELGAEAEVATARGKRRFAPGDRLLFLQNDRALGVKNGTAGTVRRVEGDRFTVQLDADGKRGAGAEVMFSASAYPHVEHGYAKTIHTSQGETASRAYVMASRHFDSSAAYVALSRHRGRVDLHAGRDEFPNLHALARRFGRRRLKDMTLDYRQEGKRMAETLTAAQREALQRQLGRGRDAAEKAALREMDARQRAAQGESAGQSREATAGRSSWLDGLKGSARRAFGRERSAGRSL